MIKMKILLVEDDSQEQKNCSDAVGDINEENPGSIELITAKTLDEAKEKLDSSFDGAIIDL